MYSEPASLKPEAVQPCWRKANTGKISDNSSFSNNVKLTTKSHLHFIDINMNLSIRIIFIFVFFLLHTSSSLANDNGLPKLMCAGGPNEYSPKAKKELGAEIEQRCKEFETLLSENNSLSTSYDELRARIGRVGPKHPLYMPRNRGESLSWAREHLQKRMPPERICELAELGQIMRQATSAGGGILAKENPAEACLLNAHNQDSTSQCLSDPAYQFVSESTITATATAAAFTFVRNEYLTRRGFFAGQYCPGIAWFQELEILTLDGSNTPTSYLTGLSSVMNWQDSIPSARGSVARQVVQYFHKEGEPLITALLSTPALKTDLSTIGKMRILNERATLIFERFKTTHSKLLEADQAYSRGFESYADFLEARRLGVSDVSSFRLLAFARQLGVDRRTAERLATFGVNSMSDVESRIDEARRTGYSSNLSAREVLQYELDKSEAIQRKLSAQDILRERNRQQREAEQSAARLRQTEGEVAKTCHKRITDTFDSAKQDQFGRWSGRSLDLSNDYSRANHASSEFRGNPVLSFTGNWTLVRPSGHLDVKSNRLTQFYCVYDAKTLRVIHVEPRL